MRWEETGMPWISPSPNIPSAACAIAYPATCFLEATNFSEGRGTRAPFQIIGAPFVESGRLVDALRAAAIPGVEFDTVSFTPTASKHAGVLCHGVSLKVVDPARFEPVSTGLHILREAGKLYSGEFMLQRRSFLRLMGSVAVYDRLMRHEEIGEIHASWLGDVKSYAVLREKYIRYR
jgi:uncharacterized protein YbbC (DUF1343 family)